MSIAFLLQAVLLSVEIVLALPIFYLLILSVAALGQRPQRQGRASRSLTHFALLIPAHNEAVILETLLASLQALDYPADLMDVHLVADNCDDATAAIARQAGIFVHERHDIDAPGKGHALRWLLGQLEAAERQYDACIFIDADAQVSPNFLQVMDARLQAGQAIIQSQYRVQNSQAAWTAGLRAVAFALFNHLRPLGRTTLGWSCGLKGTGMCFSRAVIQQCGWASFSLTEDVEQHIALVKAGWRVAYAPAAILWSAMPTSLRQAQSQQMRWERGRLELTRAYVPGLLWGALRARNAALLDAALEIVVPPLSALAGLIICCCVGVLLLPSPPDIALGLFLVGGLGAHVLIGLWLARLPRAAYRSLLFAPVFILWKLGVYLIALVSPRQRRWVRTSRQTQEQTST